jgi:hypothetical protein
VFRGGNSPKRERADHLTAAEFRRQLRGRTPSRTERQSQTSPLPIVAAVPFVPAEREFRARKPGGSTCRSRVLGDQARRGEKKRQGEARLKFRPGSRTRADLQTSRCSQNITSPRCTLDQAKRRPCGSCSVRVTGPPLVAGVVVPAVSVASLRGRIGGRVHLWKQRSSPRDGSRGSRTGGRGPRPGRKTSAERTEPVAEPSYPRTAAGRGSRKARSDAGRGFQNPEGKGRVQEAAIPSQLGRVQTAGACS